MTSPLSVMAGNKPDGLERFIATAQPRGVYSLNNRLSIPGVETVLRFQDDTWDRLPDACNTPDYWKHHNAVQVAQYELVNKTRWVPKKGNLNWLQLMNLDPKPTYVAPFNEPSIVRGAETTACATWWNDFFVECCRLIVAAGLKPCLGGFATSDLPVEALFYLLPMFRAVKAAGGVVDFHEYGVNGFLMLAPQDRSGALYYRTIRELLPEDARCDFVISECAAYSGFDETDTEKQIIDLTVYGRELVLDWPWLRFACWFQSDLGKESHITMSALDRYATAAAGINQEDVVEEWDKVVVLCPQLLTQAEYQTVAMQFGFPTKTEVAFSADSAFDWPQHAKTLKVIVLNAEDWGGAQALLDWAQAKYGRLPTVVEYQTV